MKQIFKLIFLLAFLSAFINANQAFAQTVQHEWRGKTPYGHYCPGRHWGWYGAKKIIKTSEQARKILKEFFSKADIKIGQIKEKRRFFQAEILDKNNVLIDIVIVDKRTGRIRSTY